MHSITPIMFAPHRIHMELRLWCEYCVSTYLIRSKKLTKPFSKLTKYLKTFRSSLRVPTSTADFASFNTLILPRRRQPAHFAEGRSKQTYSLRPLKMRRTTTAPIRTRLTTSSLKCRRQK